MKKLLITIIIAIVLLSITAIAIFVFASQEKAPQKTSTFETLSSVIISDGKTFQLSRFKQKEVFADLSQENLKEIFAAFDIVLDQYETIEMRDIAFVRELYWESGIKYTLSDPINLKTVYVWEENGEEKVLNHDGRLTFATDQDREILKYGMLAGVYMELFPDNWTYGRTGEQVASSGLPWHPEVLVFPDYTKYGYKNAFELFQSDSIRTPEWFYFNTLICSDQDRTRVCEWAGKSDDCLAAKFILYNKDQAKTAYEKMPITK